MTGTPRGVAALLGVIVLATAVGCGSPRAVVPAEFCKVPLPEAVLAPLMPEKGKVQQTFGTYGTFLSGGGAGCTLTVSKKLVLDVAIAYWNKDPDLDGQQDYDDRFAHAVQRPVDFPGRAIVGSDHAEGEATCTSSSYLYFTISFWGGRVDSSNTGYEKLLRFVNSLMPKLTKKLCIK